MALYLIHIRTFKVLLEYLKSPMLPFEGFILVLIDYLQIIHLIPLHQYNAFFNLLISICPFY